jgi:hypothetical protein
MPIGYSLGFLETRTARADATGVSNEARFSEPANEGGAPGMKPGALAIASHRGRKAGLGLTGEET